MHINGGVNVALVDNIRALREAFCITQTDLAKICHVTQKTVSSWETHKLNPSFKRLDYIASHFGVNREDLFSPSGIYIIKDPEDPGRYMIGVGQSEEEGKLVLTPSEELLIRSFRELSKDQQYSFRLFLESSISALKAARKEVLEEKARAKEQKKKTPNPGKWPTFKVPLSKEQAKNLTPAARYMITCDLEMDAKMGKIKNLPKSGSGPKEESCDTPKDK